MISALRQVVERTPPPPKPEEDRVVPMMVDELDVFMESSPTQVIEVVLAELETEGLESIAAPLEAEDRS